MLNRNSRFNKRSDSGFTLVELLVSVSIIITFAAIALTLFSPDDNATKPKEASRAIVGYLMKARTLAMQHDRRVYVLFERQTNVIEDASNNKALEHSGYACTRLSMAQETPSYSGTTGRERFHVRRLYNYDGTTGQKTGVRIIATSANPWENGKAYRADVEIKFQTGSGVFALATVPLHQPVRLNRSPVLYEVVGGRRGGSLVYDNINPMTDSLLLQRMNSTSGAGISLDLATTFILPGPEISEANAGSHDITTTVGIHAEFLGKPRAMSIGALEIPVKDIAIDLEFSGMMLAGSLDDFSTPGLDVAPNRLFGPMGASASGGADVQPIMIVFNGTGNVDRVHYTRLQDYYITDPNGATTGTIKNSYANGKSPTGTIFFLIGKSERIAHANDPNGPYDQVKTVTGLQPRSFQYGGLNFQDETNLWITIQPRGGAIRSVPVGGQLEGEDVSTLPNLATALNRSLRYVRAGQNTE